MPDRQHRIDHDEAYRDDPGQTTPEMEPGNSDESGTHGIDGAHIGGAAALGIGFAGAAIAGEAINEDVEDELAATTPGS